MQIEKADYNYDNEAAAHKVKEFQGEWAAQEKRGLESGNCSARKKSLESYKAEFDSARSSAYLSWMRYISLASLKVIAERSIDHINSVRGSL